ncbi:hypothetical protein LR48_Vigan03g056100 [Vigna angularis]|uniref:Uncharacterized protein n=1 Tax=Phaseolus angularis TaxID=3914 RepID=A0A0L9U316_PHAAN|nr:hypothetical protein LR48_Vigan03g056100 [Vigna angularis]
MSSPDASKSSRREGEGMLMMLLVLLLQLAPPILPIREILLPATKPNSQPLQILLAYLKIMTTRSHSLKELVSSVSLVKAVDNVDFFKLALYQLNERACHDREGSTGSTQPAQAQPAAPEVQTATSTRSIVAAKKVEVIRISSDPTQKKKRKATQEPLVSSKRSKRKKAAASTELQVLQEKFDEVVKSHKELTFLLAEVEKMAEDDKAKAKILLPKSRASMRQLQRYNDDLKLDLLCFTEKNKELTTKRGILLIKRNSLRDKVQKMEKENKFLGEEVINEHVLDRLM